MNVPPSSSLRRAKKETTNKDASKEARKDASKDASKEARKQASKKASKDANKEGSKKRKESKESSPCSDFNNIHVPTRLVNKDSDLLSTANSLRSRSTTASSFDVGIDDSKQWIHQLERELRPTANSFDLHVDQIPPTIKNKNDVVSIQHVLDDDNISSRHSAVALCTF